MFVIYGLLNQPNFVEHDHQPNYSKAVRVDKRHTSEGYLKRQIGLERDITVVIDEAGWVTYQPLTDSSVILLFSNIFRHCPVGMKWTKLFLARCSS